MAQKRTASQVRADIVNAAVELYLTNGFTKTTNKMIVERADCSPGQFSNFFRTKENLLLELVETVMRVQLKMAKSLVGDDMPPVIIFCLKTAVQTMMCENDCAMWDLYTSAYSHRLTLHHIKHTSYKNAMALLKNELPDWSEQDFYETEIMATALNYGALMEECTPRFTVEHKIRRVLDNIMKLYEIPRPQRESVLKTVMSFDLKALADKSYHSLVDAVRVAA